MPLRATSTPPCSPSASANDPTVTLDAVEAVTLLVQTIIVNSTGDLANKDPNGCCCDTGNTLADGKTPECTLRAAIDLANRPGGEAMEIQFQIPRDNPGIVNGVPSIQPQPALPDITNAVVIDGWSQSPAASSPPVELSGRALTPRGSWDIGKVVCQVRTGCRTCSLPAWPTGCPSERTVARCGDWWSTRSPCAASWLTAKAR